MHANDSTRPVVGYRPDRVRADILAVIVNIREHRLRADSDDTHTITALVTGARDLSQFRELRMMSDTDRWLLCSEGRPRLMSWLRFDPIV